MTPDAERGRDEPTTAEQIGKAGETPNPGHPAGEGHGVPSAGEQLSRGAEELEIPGDDALIADDSPDNPPLQHPPG